MSDKCPNHVRRRRGCPACERISAALMESFSATPPGSVAVEECCEDWPEQIKKVNGPIVLQSIGAGRDLYKETGGKPFRYCPWCGKARPPNS